MPGASNGAVGAVATDFGNALTVVGLDSERKAAVTSGGAGRAGAVGAGTVTGGGAVGRAKAGRCGSSADAGDVAVAAERRGAAETTSPGSMLAE
jgi:hypothetical protein